MSANSALRKVLGQLYGGNFATLRNDWEQWVKRKKMTIVCTPNPEQIVMAQEDEVFGQELIQADVLLPDGIGVLLARQILYTPSFTGERMPGTEVVEWWLREGAHGEQKTLLLGGKGNTAQLTAERFDPTGEWCVGVAGYQDVRHPQEREEKALLELLRTWRPVVIFVAFGAPAQERWLLQHRQFLEECGVKIGLVCGGALDFLSGRVERAPRWLRRLGGEWAFRLWKQPWRWRRQLRLIRFVHQVFQELVQSGRMPL